MASRGQTVKSGAREQKNFEHMDCMMEKLCVSLTLRKLVVLGLSLYSES